MDVFRSKTRKLGQILSNRKCKVNHVKVKKSKDNVLQNEHGKNTRDEFNRVKGYKVGERKKK